MPRYCLKVYKWGDSVDIGDGVADGKEMQEKAGGQILLGREDIAKRNFSFRPPGHSLRHAAVPGGARWFPAVTRGGTLPDGHSCRS